MDPSDERRSAAARLQGFLRSRVQHDNHRRYWQLRDRVVNPDRAYPTWLKLLWLYRLKRSDAFHNASTGAHLNYGARFKTPPRLPHGLNGIIVSHRAVIGADCVIFHQVTIGEAGGAPCIGDHCLIGAGAKVIGGIRIGDNVRIGAGCIVCEDVPDDCTVVMGKPRVLVRRDRAR